MVIVDDITIGDTKVLRLKRFREDDVKTCKLGRVLFGLIQLGHNGY